MQERESVTEARGENVLSESWVICEKSTDFHRKGEGCNHTTTTKRVIVKQGSAQEQAGMKADKAILGVFSEASDYPALKNKGAGLSTDRTDGARNREKVAQHREKKKADKKSNVKKSNDPAA